MIKIIPITKARTNLGAIVKKVYLDKDYVILEKDGYPVAGIISIDELEDYLDARDVDTNNAIAQSKKEYSNKKTIPAQNLLDL